jgi:hypothetical protein
MAFMKPVADHFAAYHVETNVGTELVPESVCGEIVDVTDEGETGMLSAYVEGNEIRSVERCEGWFARLSANGYLDCTEWDGPYPTEREALDAVKEQFEVDDEGELTEDAIGD